MAKLYADNQKTKHKLYLNDFLEMMPSFIHDFITSIENSTQPRTRTAYAQDLYTFFQYVKKCNPKYKGVKISDIPFELFEELTTHDINEYMSYLSLYEIDGKKYENSEAGKARKLSTLSSLYMYFIKTDMLEKNPTVNVNRPKIRGKAIITLDNEQITELIAAISSKEGLSKRQLESHEKIVERDLAIVTTFLGTGIRVSELVGLDLDDINFKNQSIRIIRKGGNEEYVYFGNETASALSCYLSKDTDEDGVIVKSPRDKLLQQNENEKALFLSLRGTRITVRSVEILVKKYSQKIRINKNITPHKLRSTYGTVVYETTNDVYLTASVLGHRNINTTAKHYAVQNEKKKMDIANKIG